MKPYQVAIVVVCLVAPIAIGLYVTDFWQIHTMKRQIRIEHQAAQAVGAKVDEPPALTVTVKDARSCLAIDHIEVGGKDDESSARVHNRCKVGLYYAEIHWKAIAPDGTTVGDGIWWNSASNYAPGEKMLVKGGFNGSLDPMQAAKIIITAESKND